MHPSVTQASTLHILPSSVSFYGCNFLQYVIKKFYSECGLIFLIHKTNGSIKFMFHKAYHCYY